MDHRRLRSAVAAMLALAPLQAAHPAGVTGADLREVVVTARRVVLQGEPRVASEGTVLGEQLDNRPLLRVGELLEVVPGLVVTQHSGDGKANQYFLRGFNLDHGTDFATSVEGMPVNMPTHGHGQGYTDLNFVIPELVDRIVYRKGTYYPELGNFSAAGAASIAYRARTAPFVSATAGQNAYARAVAGGSTAALGGDVLAALEVDRSDGPWRLSQDLRKYNGLLRYTRDHEHWGWSLDAMGYDGRWRSTDQIPLRAVESGTLDRYGAVDDSSGGDSRRYSLSAQGWARLGAGRADWSAYAMDYRLQLWSNFTYATDPVNGDQFEQYDDRRVYGGAATWSRDFAVAGVEHAFRVGADVRHDRIAPVALYRTRERVRYATVREDAVRQTLAGAWTGLATHWTPWLRTEIGLRADRFDYTVRSDLAANSGDGHASIASPKFSLALGPWRDTEFFAAVGRGFHANDARGATIAVDPVDATTPIERVTPLARATGSEIGMRTALLPRTQVALALWQLDLASELLFVGDGGTTEPSRASRRRGVELGVYARPVDYVIVDADLAWSKPRFRGNAPEGDRIPGAVERVASLGVTLDHPSGWSGGLRVRHLGPAALLEDDSVRSRSSTLVNVEAGRRLGERVKLAVALYNAFGSRANDITYWYESQLPGESAPVGDVHFHPVEPRTLRVTATYTLR
jgi:hypothetical protein